MNNRRNFLPVLLLFLALLFAWGLYTTSYTNQSDVRTPSEQQQFGVGGAPQGPQQPTTSPSPTVTQEPTPTTSDIKPTIEEILEETIPE